MSGMYGLGALTNEQRIAEAKELLPACYSQEFDDCLYGRSQSYPDCARLTELWNTNKADPVNATLEKYVDETVPYCDAPSSGLPKYAILIVASLASFAAGYFASKLI